MARYSISQPVHQVEAERLLKGRGRYTDDVTIARQAYAVFLRSPHAHADIKRIDTRAAAQISGVLAVLTGEDWAADGLGNVPGGAPPKRRDGSPGYRPPRPGLTRDRVRHVGHMVAVVVAESVNLAKDAAELIEVDYEPLPVHLDAVTGSDPDTPLLWPECDKNESFLSQKGNAEATETALASAPHVVRDTFVVSRVTANTIEPRSVVAEYDEGCDHYTVYACQQRPFVWRTMMTKHIFKISESQMTVIAGDVGGSFGMKGGLYPEVPVVVWAAKKVGRPVKWTCERGEGHIADDQARDVVINGELGFDESGKFLGIRFRCKANIGAFLSMTGFGTANGAANALCGTYALPTAHGQSAAIMTNTVPMANYRGPSSVPGTFALERLVDMAARKLKLDPCEIRRRNFISPDAMPWITPTGQKYDCGEFEKVMDKCLRQADYAGAAMRRAKAEARGMLYGVGVSSSVDPSAGPAPECAELRFDPGGTVTVLAASTAGGQCHATIYTQIVSQALGMDVEKIRVVEGDTSRMAWGSGTGAARTATLSGTNVLKAAEKIREKGRRIAAHLLEVKLDTVNFEDGIYFAVGTNKSITFDEVAKTAFKPDKLPKDMEFGLYETSSWQPSQHNVPNTFHVCELEIDPETGTIEIVRYNSVHDVGVELNPLGVRDQVQGGIAQAVGQALMEQIVFNESGQVLTGSFMDYAMPRATDICRVNMGNHPVPTKTNPLGVKGAGECGTVGALAATMNAVNDALAPLGIKNFAMPATPHRVWQAIQVARSGLSG
jgi:carbon-monoxide dehydrogenase large subunit